MGNIFALQSKRGDIDVGDFTITLHPPLGHGAFGQVCRAQKRKSKQIAAAKGMTFITDGETNTELESMARSERENMLCASGHRNIVQLLDYQVLDGTVWLFMEFCDLGDLSQYLHRNSSLDLDSKLRIKCEITNGLEHLHSLKPPIIHRDIKPENVLMKRIGDRDVAKVTDFGFAKIYNNDNLSKFINTSLKGTPRYMAPEFYLEEETGLKYTASVDVFSLGLLFSTILEYSPENESLLPLSGEYVFKCIQLTQLHTVDLSYCKKGFARQ